MSGANTIFVRLRVWNEGAVIRSLFFAKVPLHLKNAVNVAN